MNSLPRRLLALSQGLLNVDGAAYPDPVATNPVAMTQKRAQCAEIKKKSARS